MVETTDQGGRLLYANREIEPGAGRDLKLTIRPRLQKTAERLLDDALRRRTVVGAKPKLAGGAIVVMDAHNGELLTLASAPRFDPNDFSGGHSARVDIILKTPSRPMFDRSVSMAIPPGSVFKIVTAAALLEENVATADEQFECQGYLESPDRLRCAIYRRHGIGHGRVTLADALAQSCNVYFFHYATRLNPTRLADWAERFGLGVKTGVDLPSESGGLVPRPDNCEPEDKRQLGETRMLAVGQGAIAGNANTSCPAHGRLGQRRAIGHAAPLSTGKNRGDTSRATGCWPASKQHQQNRRPLGKNPTDDPSRNEAGRQR